MERFTSSQNFFDRQWGSDKFENNRSFNTISNPFQTMQEKNAFMHNTMNHATTKNIMKGNNMMYGQQHKNIQESGLQNSRFASKEGQQQAEKNYTGTKGELSRFYGNEKVSQNDIASDLGPSIYDIGKKQDKVAAIPKVPVKQDDVEMKDVAEEEKENKASEQLKFF